MLDLKELKEFAKHGNSLFPLEIYDCWFEVDGLLVPYHWHNEIEIIYVEKGKIGVTINAESKIVNEGEMIFINSEDLHQINSIGDNYSRYYALVFSPDLLSFKSSDHCEIACIRPLINKTLKLPQSIDRNKDYSIKVLDLFKEILEEYKFQQPGWYLDVKSCMYKLFSIFTRENIFIELSSDISHVSYKEDQIKKALEYIHNNFNEKIYIDDIASALGINTQYFCRFFKSIIGKTPIEYINRYRINAASEFLQHEDISIIDVCFRVGFENQSYFIKLFKKYNNMTPLEYKKIFLNSNY